MIGPDVGRMSTPRLFSDDVRQGSFAQSGRSCEEHMIHGFSRFCSLHVHLEILNDLFLADILIDISWSQRRVFVVLDC